MPLGDKSTVSDDPAAGKVIVLTAGGSGGHLTPLLSVASELKAIDPACHLVYIGQKGDSLGDIMSGNELLEQVHFISAGKFRRYHTEGWQQWFDIRTFLLNTRDFFRVLAGIWQSYWLLGKIRPDVIFTRGGFVSVPVGLTAGWRRIPYITHDSDAIPSLANRIISKRARMHMVALPKEIYWYPQDKTVQVGIPLAREYKEVTSTMKTQYRHEIELPENAQAVFVIGGGLGAQRLNEAVALAAPALLSEFPNLYLYHVVGRPNEKSMRETYSKVLDPVMNKRVAVKGFINDVYRYSGASDVVVTRAGATNLAEFALQQRACIIVPNPLLTAGHQLRNAKELADAGAVVVVHETDKLPEELITSLRGLLGSEKAREALEKAIAAFAMPGAAKHVAEIILGYAEGKGGGEEVS